MGRTLQGVPRLGSEKDQFLSPIAALAAALQSEGLHTDYGSLMCLGGGAFRACWNAQWATRSAVACSEDVVATAAATQGFAATTQMNEELEDVWSAIVSSIDSGVPLLTCGLAGSPEWAVIVGYEERPRTVLYKCRPDASQEIGLRDFGGWEGWTHTGNGRMPLTTLRRVGKVVGDVEAFKASIGRAVRFAGEGEFSIRDASGREMRFSSGASCFSTWAADVLRMSEGVDEAGFNARLTVIDLNVRAIVDARRAATGCLEKFKRRGTHQIYDLTVAADRYARVVAALQEAGSALSGKAKAGECSAAIQRAGEEEGKAVAALSRAMKELP